MCWNLLYIQFIYLTVFELGVVIFPVKYSLDISKSLMYRLRDTFACVFSKRWKKNNYLKKKFFNFEKIMRLSKEFLFFIFKNILYVNHKLTSTLLYKETTFHIRTQHYREENKSRQRLTSFTF